MKEYVPLFSQWTKLNRFKKDANYSLNQKTLQYSEEIETNRYNLYTFCLFVHNTFTIVIKQHCSQI